jgi:DNA-binding transcriptional MocR family regulator
MAERTVLLNSASKVMAPGVRVGWLRAEGQILRSLEIAKQGVGLQTAVTDQLAVAHYLATYDLDAHIRRVADVYRERRDAMLAALEAHLPEGSTWNIPDGGFYVWLTVPEGVDTKAMLPRAVTARVAYASGTGFYADGFGSQQLRLSYCYPTPERITEGVRRLAGVLEAELDVVRTFGSAARPRPAIQGPPAPSPDTT